MKSYADNLTWHALFIIGYALLSFIFIGLAPSSTYQSLFWPCSGVALVFILFFGYRATLSILLSGLIVYAVIKHHRHETIGTLTLSVVVLLPALQAALAYFLVNHFNGRNYWLFNHWRRFLGFIFWGGFVPAIPLSLCLTFCVVHEEHIAADEVFYVCLSVFAGNFLGVVITAPCLLLLAIKNNRISDHHRLGSIIPVLILFFITLMGYTHLYHLFKQDLSFKNQTTLDQSVAVLKGDFSRISESFQSVRYYLMANDAFFDHNFYHITSQVYDNYKKNNGEPFFGFGIVQSPHAQVAQPYDLTTSYTLTKVYPIKNYRFLHNIPLVDKSLSINSAVSGELHFLTNIDAVRHANGDFLLIGFQALDAANPNLLLAIIFNATAFFDHTFSNQASHFKSLKVDDFSNGRTLYKNDPKALFDNTDNAIYEQFVTLGDITLRVTVAYEMQWFEREVQRHLLLMGLVALSLIGVFTVMILAALVGLHSLLSIVNKQALELENEKIFLDSIFDHLPVLVSVKDAKTRRYIRVNKMMEVFYGVKRGGFRGNTANEILPSTQALDDMQYDHIAVTEKKAVDFGGQWQLVADKKCYLNIQKLPIFNASGEVIYILGIAEELTDKVEFQDNLAKRNELISLGLDATGLGSWEWLRDGNQFFLSPTFCAIIGVDSNTFRFSGKMIESLIFEEDIAQMLAANAQAKRSFEVTEFCCRVHRSDGCIIWVSGKYRYFAGTDNIIARALGVLWDSTAENLLQQDNLKKTEELKRSNAELDSFAYIASHDLKEPLRGLSNYATFLQEDYADKLDGDGVAMLKSLVRLTAKMDTLISDVLNFSRLGRTELAYKNTDIDAVIVDVLESLLPRLSELNMHVVYLSSMPNVWCDSVRITEVFRNLITNAMKYNDAPHKTIELDCRRQEDEWVFSVKDNGIGIAPAFQYRVFDMFKRLHAQQEYGGGSGVGLSIVQKIVYQHGGKIGLTSVLGAGTTVSFSLPCNATS